MPCLNSARGQDTPDISVFGKADSLYFAHDFEYAALEYERAIFHGTTPDVINTALFGRVQCFKQMRQFEKASTELLRIRLYTLNPNQAIDYYYEKILCYYLSGSFNETVGTIDQMYLHVPDSASCNHTLILQILTYNELQQWDQAKQTALIYASTFPSHQKDSMETLIHQLYAKKNLPKLKKEKVSKVLAFIPGLAHIYAGYWMEGSVSFLLNVATLSFGVYEIWNGYYITGYLFGAGILSATYFGGFNRSSFLLHKRNDESVNLFKNHAREELLKP